MKDLGLVSVIVPIYNIEKYIERCIVSLISQTYSNIEIILVNDGSVDTSAEICKKYTEIDKRVLLYNKKNGGLSDARNYGMSVSRGEYFVFVDGDDYVSRRYIEKLLYTLCINQAEVALCSFKVITDNGQLISHALLNETKKVILGKELLALVLTDFGYKYVVAWNKIYKKDVFSNIRFDKGKLYEDEFINFKLFYDCQRIAIETDELYYYVQRQGSITSDMSSEKIDMKYELHKKRIKFYKKKNEIALYERSVQMYCNWLVETFRKYYYCLTEQQKKILICESRRYAKTVIFSNQSSLGEKLQDFLILISMRLAAAIKSILRRDLGR